MDARFHQTQRRNTPEPTARIANAGQASFLADTNYFTEQNARFFFDSGMNGYVR